MNVSYPPQGINDVAPFIINGTGTALPLNQSLYDILLANAVANTFQQQPDANLNQANPVSDTLYTVLDTTPNCLIESVDISITWAVTQPTNLRIVCTVDGRTRTFIIASPVSATSYFPQLAAYNAESSQVLGTSSSSLFDMACRLMSGRSVKIEAAITWAVTQPSPLYVVVKYAKR